MDMKITPASKWKWNEVQHNVLLKTKSVKREFCINQLLYENANSNTLNYDGWL